MRSEAHDVADTSSPMLRRHNNLRHPKPLASAVFYGIKSGFRAQKESIFARPHAIRLQMRNVVSNTVTSYRSEYKTE